MAAATPQKAPATTAPGPVGEAMTPHAARAVSPPAIVLSVRFSSIEIDLVLSTLMYQVHVTQPQLRVTVGSAHSRFRS